MAALRSGHLASEDIREAWPSGASCAGGTLRRSAKDPELVRDDAVVVQCQLHESVRGCWFGEAVSVEAPRSARHT
ncbi:MAG: hypothetical protein K0Q71_5732 [Thermomicrobiales bacterium]|nr:hypothetical protein [Thermomicrobiales bacterium]